MIRFCFSNRWALLWVLAAVFWPLRAAMSSIQFEPAAYTVNEGGGEVTLTVTRTGDSSAAAVVSYVTTSGTAEPNGDYVPQADTLTWAAGDSSPKTIVVPILDYGVLGSSLTFGVRLTGGEVGAPAQAQVTIVDDQTLPTNCVLHYKSFITLPGAILEDATVTLANGTFTANEYEAADAGVFSQGVQIVANAPQYVVPGFLGFYGSIGFPVPAGQTGYDSPVGDYTGHGASGLSLLLPVTGLSLATTQWQILQAVYDRDGRPLQFAANFTSLDAAGQIEVQGEVRFHSDVPLRGAVVLTADHFQANKSDAVLTVSATRIGDTSVPISVAYKTADYGAVQGVDYTKTAGTLDWAAGDTAPKTFTVPLLHDPAAGSRVFFVRLTGDNAGNLSTAALTIVDDGQPAVAGLPEPNGGIDASYNLGLSNSSEVRLKVITPLADGGALIGGNFVYVNGPPQPGIVRLNAQGLPDPAFQSPISAAFEPAVNAIVVQPDGHFLVAGRFVLNAPGAPVAALVRLNPTGTVDAGFNLDTHFSGSTITSLALQPDGRVLVTGDFASGSGLARLNADGSLDAGFSSPVVDFERQNNFVVLQPDGRSIVGDDDGKLTRFNADGTADGSYRPAASCNLSLNGNQVVLQPDGRLVVPPYYTQGRLVRFNHDGTLDATFTADPAAFGGDASVSCLALQPDGRLLVGLTGDGGAGSIVRLHADGSLDKTFQLAGGLPAAVGAMALEPDGSLLLSAGAFSLPANGVVHTVLARLSAVVDRAVVTVAADAPRAVKTSQEDGRLVFTRTGDLSGPLTVKYVVKGTAQAGIDYVALTGHKKIKAGESTAVVKIRPLAGMLGRGTRGVKVVVDASGDYSVGAASSAKVKIVDGP